MKSGNICFFILTLLFVCVIPEYNSVFASENEYRVKSIKFYGNEYFRDANIRSLMETKSKTLINKFKVWKKAPVFNEEILKADIQRIIKKYQTHGFIDAAIEEPQLKYNDKKKTVYITLNIYEGKRVTVNKIEYQLNDSSDSFIDAIRNQMAIRENSYFNDENFLNDLRFIKKYFDEIGYPSASVDYKLHLNENNDYVDINITINTGYKTYFGAIEFIGAEKTDEKLLKRLLTVKEENQYNALSVQQSRARLQSLELFRLVSINLKIDKDTSIAPVEIFLQENPTYNLNFGVGYGIEDRFRVYTQLTKMRFLGGLRKGILYAKHSALEPLHLSFTLFQPAFPALDSNLEFNPFFRIEDEPAYALKRTGANLSVNHKISEKTQTYLSYTFESNNLKEGAADAVIGISASAFDQPKHYKKSSVSWGLIRDSSKPLFYPSAGALFSNIITLSGYVFEADYHFWRWLSEWRTYQKLNPALIAAFKIKAGMLKLLKHDNYVPYEERFYAGGTYSVRGWSRAMLGPKNFNGEPIGGKSIFESSVELRYPVWKNLSGVVFLDGGNVWKDTMKYEFNNLHYAAGLGLRYVTPVGAGRLDFASPVFEGKYSIQFFISLGQAF